MYIFTFTITNIIFFFFLLILIILVFTDERFSLIRKLLFILLNICLIILSIYLEKLPHIIIKDLFWYSLILNGSFILHVVILSRIFNWCWKRHYEYLGHIISRISFTLSLSFLLYIIRKYYYYIIYLISDYHLNYYYEEYIQSNKKLNKLLYIYAKFFIKYIEKKNFYSKIFLYIRKFLYKLQSILKIILIHFSLVFHNYSIILLGKSNITFNKNFFFKYISIFIIFLGLSIILGVPRIYLIWISQAIFELYKIFNYEYNNANSRDEIQKLNFFNKLKYSYKNYHKTPYLHNCYYHKYLELEKIYEIPYHTFFMFDLCKFLDNEYEGEYKEVWGSFFNNYEHTIESKYPITEIYKFYPWEDMAKGYFFAIDKLYKNAEDDWGGCLDQYRIKEGKKWCYLINKGDSFLLKLMPDVEWELKEESINNNNNK